MLNNLAVKVSFTLMSADEQMQGEDEVSSPAMFC